MNANCGKTADMPLAVPVPVNRFEIFGQTSPLTLQSTVSSSEKIPL
jgi:hypothetical protein